MTRAARKRRDTALTCQTILEAAARAFAKRGYHGTTMEEVAREVGYSVGALYTYFDGKEALYSALLDFISEQFEAIHEEPLPLSLTFRQRLEWVVMRQLGVVEKNRDFFVMFLAQRSSFDWELGNSVGDKAREGYLRWVDRTVELVKVGLATGELRRPKGANERDMAFVIVGAVNATLFRWLGGELEGPLRDFAPTLVGLLLEGLGSDARRVV